MPPRLQQVVFQLYFKWIPDCLLDFGGQRSHPYFTKLQQRWPWLNACGLWTQLSVTCIHNHMPLLGKHLHQALVDHHRVCLTSNHEYSDNIVHVL